MILTIRNHIVKVEMELSFFEKQQKKMLVNQSVNLLIWAGSRCS